MPDTDNQQTDAAAALPNPCEETKRAAGRRSGASAAQDSGLLPEALEELNATVEELRVAEEEMRAQNEELLLTRLRVEAERHRYQDLFEFAPDGYLVTTPEGSILEANRAASHLLGIAPRFLKGRSLAASIAPDDLPTYSAALAAATFPAPTAPLERSLRLRRRHAGPFHAAVTVASVAPVGKQPAALRWLIRDVSERRAAEEERLAHAQTVQAEAAERQIRAILETVTEPFVTLDRDWRFTSFNAAAAALVRDAGKDPDALRDQVIWDAFPTAFGAAFQTEALRAAQTRQGAAFEAHSHGLGRRLRVRVFPTESGVVICAQDTTAHGE